MFSRSLTLVTLIGILGEMAQAQEAGSRERRDLPRPAIRSTGALPPPGLWMANRPSPLPPTIGNPDVLPRGPSLPPPPVGRGGFGPEYVGYGGGYPWYGYGGRYWAVDLPGGTVAESYARGLADVIRAKGEYNLDTSAAAIQWQTARGLAQENWLNGIHTYFQGRMLNAEYRRALRPPPLTLEQQLRLAELSRPRRLTSSELDPQTGRILWPLILQREAFDSLRSKLDALAAERAEGDGLNVEGYLEMRRLAQAIREELKTQIFELPANDYIFASDFLRSLAYEVALSSQYGPPAEPE